MFIGEVLQTPDQKGPGALPWVTGGAIALLAVALYAIEMKGPAPLRRAST